MSTKRIDYSGKKVYVGVDVHKKTYSISVCCDQEIIDRATVKAMPEVLISYLAKRFDLALVSCAYEAGFCGFGLHRKLVEKGINNIVVHPPSIEVASNDRVKTDKRDSKKIAIQLESKRLRSIYIPSESEELGRLLTRRREALIKDRTRIACRIKGRLMQFGYFDPDDNRIVSERFLKEVEALKVPVELSFDLSILIKQWRFLRDQIKSIDVQIKENAEKNEHATDIYRSVPGIGLISAHTLLTELGDMSRFKNERSLGAFTGLTPSEYSSGEHIRKGHITRQGSSRIRRILTEVSWRAIRKDEALHEIFTRIAATRGKKRAITAVARRLICRIRSCFNNKEKYVRGTFSTANHALAQVNN